MPQANEKNESIKVVARNRRASFKYEITETVEAGIVLTGPEVKSIRLGNVDLQDGFGRIEGAELFLWNVHVKPYAYGSSHVVQEPRRTRKLLVHRNEIKRWLGRTTEKGLVITPLEIYLKNGRIKVKLGLGKGKVGPDRREDIKKKDLNREMQREFGGSIG